MSRKVYRIGDSKRIIEKSTAKSLDSAISKYNNYARNNDLEVIDRNIYVNTKSAAQMKQVANRLNLVTKYNKTLNKIAFGADFPLPSVQSASIVNASSLEYHDFRVFANDVIKNGIRKEVTKSGVITTDVLHREVNRRISRVKRQVERNKKYDNPYSKRLNEDDELLQKSRADKKKMNEKFQTKQGEEFNAFIRDIMSRGSSNRKNSLNATFQDNFIRAIENSLFASFPEESEKLIAKIRNISYSDFSTLSEVPSIVITNIYETEAKREMINRIDQYLNAISYVASPSDYTPVNNTYTDKEKPVMSKLQQAEADFLDVDIEELTELYKNR